MKLTDEQFKALAPYEEHFTTAIKGKWYRNLPRTAIDLIHSIRFQVTGYNQRMNKSCSHCILRLLQDMGAIYFEDKQERIDRENDKKAVEITLQEAKPKKVQVKTTTGRGGRGPKKAE